MTIGVDSLQKSALVGGKTQNRIVYLQYRDSAAPIVHKIAKLKWPEADLKPTFISSTTVENIINIIEIANPSIDIDYPSYASSYNSMLMIGASDYGSFFVCFRDTSNPKVRYIAEIGASALDTEGPIWGSNDWCFYATYLGPGGCSMNGGMSSSTSELITGIEVGGVGYIDIFGVEHTRDIRAAVYTGGTLSDPTGATLLWDAGIITMEPGEYGTRWGVTHPGGGVVLPADTVTWICLKFWNNEGNTSIYTNMVLNDSLLPVDSSTCGDFQNNRGRYHLNIRIGGLLDGIPNPEVVDDDVTVAFPGTIPSGGIWDGAPEWRAKIWLWPIAYLTLAEEEGSSISASEEPDPEDPGWTFLRLIDFYDYTSETDIKFIDIVGDEVYITAGNSAIESTYLSDDFTGSNGDPPESKRWDITAGSPDIQNNKLELTQIGAGTADYVTTTYAVGGVYEGTAGIDVSVDFELMNYAAVESWGIDLVLNYYEYKTPWAYVRFGYWDGQYGYQLGYYSSGWHVIDAMIGGSPHITGKLRIVSRKRQNEAAAGYDELKAYYWDGSVWVLIGEHDAFGIREVTFSLLVANSTPAQNITWRADNFIVKAGFNIYREIYVYATNSYNTSTKQFETLIRSKNTEVYDVFAVSAGTEGCVAMRYKHGWYGIDQPHECYTDLVSYDASLNEVAVSCLRAEYVLGNLCTWQRDIYFGDNWLEAGPWLVCGNYPGHLFFIGTLLFLNGEDDYLALIEVDSTTLKPIRASRLQLANTIFDGSQIQDAIAVP